MSETISRPADYNGHMPAEPGTYEHLLPGARVSVPDPAPISDGIIMAMTPLLCLADAYPVMVELLSEHLQAVAGEPEDGGLSATDVADHWNNLRLFILLYQDMLLQDHPAAMGRVDLLEKVPAAPFRRGSVVSVNCTNMGLDNGPWGER